MNLVQSYPYVHQAVIDIAANEGCRKLAPVTMRRVDECIEDRQMSQQDLAALDCWLSRLSPEEMSCLTEGDPDDALDLMLDSPEMLAGDCVGEVLADIAMVV